MSDSEKPIIEAKYMNAWLGDNAIQDITPKTMFDILTLCEYYKDIIVPDKNVKVDYMVEGVPCASVKENTIYIPHQTLLEGKVDRSIGSTIHELNHIKSSMNEHESCFLIFQTIRDILKRIKLPSGQTADRVIFSDTSVTSKDFLDIDNDPRTNEIAFVRKMMMDIAKLLNATEDVRIDANTPPNLRKYVVEGEQECCDNYVKTLKEQDLGDGSDFELLPFSMLFHYKGIKTFPFVDEVDLDVHKDIINEDAMGMTMKVLSAYFPQIESHIANSFSEDESWLNQDEEGGSVTDMYFGDRVGDTVSESLSDQMKQDTDKGSGNFCPLKYEESELPQKDKEIEVSRESKQPKTKEKQDAIKMISETQDLNHEKQNQTSIKPDYYASIKAFKDMTIVTTQENFSGSDKTTNYKTIITDATK